MALPLLPARDDPAGPPLGPPVLFGELLFDRLPDGQELLGGAPLNLAWSLAGLGYSPLLISRVGHDARGERALAAMTDWGLTTAGIQRDENRPTGLALVAPEGQEPRFRIPGQQAFDAIDPDIACSAARAACLLYHGTLAAREPGSCAALQALRRSLTTPRIVDLNLRPPFDADARVLAAGARTVKLSEPELDGLSPADEGPWERRLNRARGRLGAITLVVTQAERGAQALSPKGEILIVPAAPLPGPFVDSVGAGDAFMAGLIAGQLENWPLEIALRRSAELAAMVCAYHGACSAPREHYQTLRATWQQEDARLGL